MTYYGWVNGSVADVKEVYKILQKALSLIPEDKPYRGPKEYIEGDYFYSNNFTGEVNIFSGEETIKFKGEELYKAKYIGGLVDQRIYGRSNYIPDSEPT